MLPTTTDYRPTLGSKVTVTYGRLRRYAVFAHASIFVDLQALYVLDKQNGRQKHKCSPVKHINHNPLRYLVDYEFASS